MYLDFLYCLDMLQFVSWQIVNSSTSMSLFGPRTAMSGRSDWNSSDNVLKLPPSRSTKIFLSALHCWRIQSARMLRILSCLSLYRLRENVELQWDMTCLLLWIYWQRGHSGSLDFPHLTRFDAVGSCCWSAFLTNLYNGGASFSISFTHFVTVDLANASLMAFMIWPWIVRVWMWFELFRVWVSFKTLRADFRSSFSRMILSMVVFFPVVSFQIVSDSAFPGKFCLNLWFNRSVSATSLSEGMPRPHWLLGSDSISETHELMGNSIQSLTQFETCESRLRSIHV